VIVVGSPLQALLTTLCFAITEVLREEQLNGSWSGKKEKYTETSIYSL
jgi:hypothetical protein